MSQLSSIISQIYDEKSNTTKSEFAHTNATTVETTEDKKEANRDIERLLHRITASVMTSFVPDNEIRKVARAEILRLGGNVGDKIKEPSVSQAVQLLSLFLVGIYEPLYNIEMKTAGPVFFENPIEKETLRSLDIGIWLFVKNYREQNSEPLTLQAITSLFSGYGLSQDSLDEIPNLTTALAEINGLIDGFHPENIEIFYALKDWAAMGINLAITSVFLKKNPFQLDKTIGARSDFFFTANLLAKSLSDTYVEIART